MTAQERNRAAALLRRTNYGAALTFEGMAPYLNEETRRYGQEYARSFMRSPTPEARRRAEELLGILAR